MPWFHYKIRDKKFHQNFKNFFYFFQLKLDDKLKLFSFSFRYMVDAADLDKMEASRNELHSLLDKPQLAGIPVLVLGNKRDLPGALEETGLIERM